MDQGENSSLCVLIMSLLGLLSSREWTEMLAPGAAQCPSAGADQESCWPPRLRSEGAQRQEGSREREGPGNTSSLLGSDSRAGPVPHTSLGGHLGIMV